MVDRTRYTANLTSDSNLYVDISTDKVGIGTTNPTSKLSVVGDVNISGAVTATSFVGDGSQLTGIANGIGINTVGGLVGFGVTYLHLYGAGISTTFYDSSVGIATIFIEGGGGSGSISISKVSPYSPSSGDLWYSPDYGRTFIYYDESTVGYGSDAYWVDAAPFNVSNVDGGGASVSISTVAPTSPSSGDLWYNSNLGRTFIYYTDDDSSQWVDSSPFNFTGITTSTYTENSFIATAGQTVFNVTYDVGYLEVYLNGIRLSSSEYTATNGTSVTLNSAASGGDVVDIIEVTTNRGPVGPTGPQGPEITIPGPYTDDSDAANNNVEVGSPYYKSTGLVYVRLT